MRAVRRPITFLQFCARLGVVLEGAQTVLCRVAFDGVDPIDLAPDERAIAAQVFGPRVERFSPLQRQVLVVSIGARSGKTYLLIALRALHLALTVDLSRLAPGEIASGNLVAPDLDLATQALQFIRGAIRQQPRISAMCRAEDIAEGTKAQEINMRRGGKPLVFKCRAASGKGGRTGRGRSLFGAFLDEACLFYDSDHKVNDKDVYDANQPRVMGGGQTIVASTPWAKTGLLWEMHEKNFGHPETCMVAHAPTSIMRTDPAILAQVERAYLIDPDNARREFGAEFMSGDVSQFFDADTIEQCVDSSLSPSMLPKPGMRVAAGADFGFSRNSSALAISHLTGDRILVPVIDEWKPDGAPLKPSLVCEHFAALCREHGAKGLMADGHYREAVREDLERHGLFLSSAPEGMTGKARSYIHARTMMREKKIAIPRHELLIKQLKATLGKSVSGGGMTFPTQQTADGRHGDLVSAFVLAVWQHGEKVAAPVTKPGTAAYYEQLERELEERDERQANGWDDDE